MNMEHDVIMEEKVEQLSERLEEFILDAFISVLISLNEHRKLILKSVKDEDIQFWLSGETESGAPKEVPLGWYPGEETWQGIAGCGGIE